MDAMGASVCNGRVIKSCMDPISSVWRAEIAVEAIYPPQLPPWLGFVSSVKIKILRESQPIVEVCAVVNGCHGEQVYVMVGSSKSCMDPISSVWRAGIAVEAIYPPQLPPWLGFVSSESRFFAHNLNAKVLVCAVVNGLPWGKCM